MDGCKKAKKGSFMNGGTLGNLGQYRVSTARVRRCGLCLDLVLVRCEDDRVVGVYGGVEYGHV